MRLFRSAICVFTFLICNAAFAQSADTYITKDAPANTTAGSNIVYTIVVGNVGPDDAANVVMNDALPAGLTFVSRTDSGPDAFSCSDPGVGNNGTVNCTAATMTAGNQHTFTLTVAVPNNAPDGTTYINQATVNNDFDNNTENNSAIAATSTPPDQADVSIVKSGPSAAAVNTDVTYTITLSNAGPSDAQSVSWTDTLPSGTPSSPMTFVSFNQTSGPTFNCPSPGTTVSCTLQTFPAGSTATFQFVGHIPAGTSPGTTYTNETTQSTSNDSNPENDTSSTTLTAASSDIGIVKSAPPTANAGGTLDYVITLTNGGPNAAADVTFNDYLSPYETFVSIVKNSGPAATCTPSNTAVTCTVGALSNGQNAQFTVTVSVATSTPNGTVITNTATVSSDSADPNTSNNTSSASTTISTSADVSVAKSGPASANAGTNVAYTIVVANNGPSDAASVTMADTLPAGTTFVSFNQSSGPAFNCTTGATVSCSIATLTAGSSANFTLTVAVNSGTAAGTLSNTASVVSTTPDPNSGNNSSTAPVTVSTSADVSIAKTAPANVNAGANLSYSITVANNGPSDAASVSFSDTLPPGTTFVSENQTSGPAFNCTTGATVTCSIASLPNGATAKFTIVAGVSNSTPNNTTLSNTANVTSTTADGNPTNNSSTASTTVAASADLAITKGGPGTQIGAGFDLTYTITAVNHGPTDAFNMTLTDTLPPGTTFGSLQQTSGPSFNCTTGATVTCSIATFTNGSSAAFQLTVHNGAAAGTTVTNTATISSTTSDPNPTNNSSSSSVQVVTTIPLLSPSMLMLLALALSAGAWVAMRKM